MQVLLKQKIILNILQVNLMPSKINLKALFKENTYRKSALPLLTTQIFILMGQWAKSQFRILKFKLKNSCNKKWRDNQKIKIIDTNKIHRIKMRMS